MQKARVALAEARVSYRWERDDPSQSRLGHAAVRFVIALVLPREFNLRFHAERGRAHELHRLLKPLIRSHRERVSLLSFVFRLFLLNAFSRSPRDRDVTLRVSGARYVVGLLTTEPYTLAEIHIERQHDQSPEFIPKDGWVVLDVGANVGMYTVLQARRGAMVFAFEPNPDCYRRLIATVKANQLTSRVTVHNYALGAAEGGGAIKLADGGRDTTSGRVIYGDPSVLQHAVRIAPLDDVTRQLQISHIDLLKIDVEGSELLVLAGARATLRTVDRLVVECHSASLEQQTTAFLNSCGFIAAGRVPVGANDDVHLQYFRRIDQSSDADPTSCCRLEANTR